MADKRMTVDDVVAELRDGMTIGVGGWGSRRKPMLLVRAIARSSLKDLTLVSYGGPDVGLLCATGKLRKIVCGFVSLDSIPLEPHFRAARQSGAVEVVDLDEGMLQWGLYAAALRLPFLPTRAGLGSDVMKLVPELRTVKSPYDDGEELVAMPAITLDVALIHMNRADARGNGQFLGPDLYFDDLFCMAAKRRFMSAERIVPTEHLLDEGSVHTLAHLAHDGGRCRRSAGRGALHFVRARLRARRSLAARIRRQRREPRSVERLSRQIPGGGVMTDYSLDELCAVACAEAWRGDGEILASPIGVIPSIGARLAKATFAPDLLLSDGIASIVANTLPLGGSSTAKIVEGYAAVPHRSSTSCGRAAAT